ncbi:hypothetical protein H9Q74_009136 [Fusarium xylarioides]|nr:hypothetical protein H9Q71_002909 [Fusarium xylarioides]KAG5819988.1 hypothetical protein H9Q74_009136 [Fusarium xylarioides]
MSSRPPTPPNKPPWEDEDFRFATNGTACEWGEAYHPSGYHPVHLGDVIQERYRIIRKVGWGQYSTVWLAVDMQVNRYVSLKITLATQPNNTSKEVSLYRSHLQDESPYLIVLHETIKITGPNGEHDGLVFETMGPNLTTLLKIRSEFQIEMNLKQSESDAQPLTRKDGKNDLWAPSYLLEPRPLNDYFSYGLHPIVKLGDLGGAFNEEDPIMGSKAITPVALRAPETILNERLGKAIDVWAFGCLIFEMITGRPLFVAIQSLEGEDYDETSNDEHLIQLWEVIGPLPKSLLKKWRRADQYFDANGNRLEVKPQDEDYVSGDEDMESGDGTDEESDGPPLAYLGRFLSLEDQFMAERPGDIDEAEAKEILELLRWIFQYDPAHRPSTGDLINHPWLRSTP